MTDSFPHRVVGQAYKISGSRKEGARKSSLLCGTAYVVDDAACYRVDSDGRKKRIVKLKEETLRCMCSNGHSQSDKEKIYYDPAVMLSSEFVKSQNFRDLPVYREHDPSKVIGKVLMGSFDEDSGKLDVTVEITEPSTAREIKTCDELEEGSFSIGYHAICDNDTVTEHVVEEISLVRDPFFKPCVVSVFANNAVIKNPASLNANVSATNLNSSLTSNMDNEPAVEQEMNVENEAAVREPVESETARTNDSADKETAEYERSEPGNSKTSLFEPDDEQKSAPSGTEIGDPFMTQNTEAEVDDIDPYANMSRDELKREAENLRAKTRKDAEQLKAFELIKKKKAAELTDAFLGGLGGVNDDTKRQFSCMMEQVMGNTKLDGLNRAMLEAAEKIKQDKQIASQVTRKPRSGRVENVVSLHASKAQTPTPKFTPLDVGQIVGVTVPKSTDTKSKNVKRREEWANETADSKKSRQACPPLYLDGITTRLLETSVSVMCSAKDNGNAPVIRPVYPQSMRTDLPGWVTLSGGNNALPVTQPAARVSFDESYEYRGKGPNISVRASEARPNVFRCGLSGDMQQRVEAAKRTPMFRQFNEDQLAVLAHITTAAEGRGISFSNVY